jgi:hypothetical protein
MRVKEGNSKLVHVLRQYSRGTIKKKKNRNHFTVNADNKIQNSFGVEPSMHSPVAVPS